jgi:GNAT superfamily N-acetyltransferase
MSITVHTVPFDDPAALELRAAMTAEVTALYGGNQQFGGGTLDPATVLWTGIALVDGHPIGHACLRRVAGDIELKRMYVAPAHRGTGVSLALMEAVERAAREQQAARLALRTGVNQPGAMRLYERLGYTAIPVFGPYADEPEARFYAKTL